MFYRARVAGPLILPPEFRNTSLADASGFLDQEFALLRQEHLVARVTKIDAGRAQGRLKESDCLLVIELGVAHGVS